MSQLGFDVIDADGHVVETRADLERYGWKGSAGELLDLLLGWDSAQDWKHGLHPEVDAGAYDVTARLADMDREGIDCAISYPTPLLGISDIPDPDSSVAACRAYNDWFAEDYHRPSDGRMHAMALVCLRRPEEAAREARRAITELGRSGSWCSRTSATTCTSAIRSSTCSGPCSRSSGGRWGSTAAAAPARLTSVPARSATTRASTPCRTRSSRWWPWAISRSAASWSASRGSRWSSWSRDRLDALLHRPARRGLRVRPGGLDRRPLGAGAAAERVRARRRCYFSCEPDEPNLPVMIDALGADRVIFASDYPHFDCKFPDSARILARRGDLDAETLRRVAGANARALYGL